jgi:hypothetical protein
VRGQELEEAVHLVDAGADQPVGLDFVDVADQRPGERPGGLLAVAGLRAGGGHHEVLARIGGQGDGPSVAPAMRQAK